MPGSTEPLRVAIISPSSGVKPIVVSTQRPPRTAAAEQPWPRWQITRRSSAARSRPAARPRAARSRRGSARGSRSGGCPSRASRLGHRVGARRGRQTSRGRRCRRRRRAARRAAPPRPPRASRARADCAAARASASAAMRARTSGVIRTDARELAAVHDAMPDGASATAPPGGPLRTRSASARRTASAWPRHGTSSRSRARRRARADSIARDRARPVGRPPRAISRLARRLHERALQAARPAFSRSTRTTALARRVRAQTLSAFGRAAARFAARLARPAPVADLRHVLAVLLDVLLVLDQLVADRLLEVRGPRAELRQAVDHVLRQVEAVEIVEHDHVERRRGACPPPCSRAREGCRGSCAGRSGGGSATDSRGRRR